MRRIIDSTDDKNIGIVFNEDLPIVLYDVAFDVTKTQEISAGIIRYSNSNYTILTEKV